MILPVRPHRAPRASRPALLLLAALVAACPVFAQPEPTPLFHHRLTTSLPTNTTIPPQSTH
ncbi:MAG: hypothetical protein H7067_14610, partial [Burkholderiales bacterium]|nr:hypothetical protein [Opitutaceae bacterium]